MCTREPEPVRMCLCALLPIKIRIFGHTAYPISGQKNYPSKRPQTVCFKESTKNLADEKQKSRPCAGDMHMDMSQDPLRVEIHRTNAGRYYRDTRFVRACAVEMHMDMSQEPVCVEMYLKMPNANPRHPFCASVRSRNAHGHFTRAILYGYRENAKR